MTRSDREPRNRKLQPPTVFFLAVVLMAGLHFLLPFRQIVPWPWRLLGIIPLALGVVLNLWTDGLFKQANTTVKPFEKPRSLIITGPFRFTRHPMYLGMTIVLIGLWVLLGTVLPILVVPLFVLAMSVVFIPVEERAMAEQFGEEYRTYCKRVRRWL